MSIGALENWLERRRSSVMSSSGSIRAGLNRVSKLAITRLFISEKKGVDQ